MTPHTSNTSNGAAHSAAPQLFTTPATAHKLSPSQVGTWLDCSARWYYKHAMQLPEPETAALLIGHSVHAAIAANYRQKIESRKDAPLDQVLNIYDQAWKFGAPETRFADDEDPAALASKGRECVQVYLRDAAPFVQPAAVELNLSGEIGGVPVGGFVDVLDVDGRIIDLKTAAKKPYGISASHSLQITSYAILADQTLGGIHSQARIDTVTKTKTPEFHPVSVPINDSRRKHAAILYPLAQDGMRHGLIVPRRDSYLCSRKHCAYWSECEAEFGGEVKE